MGQQSISEDTRDGRIRQFTQAVLNDLRALEQMLQAEMFETGIQRVGVEQEMALVGPSSRPAAVSTEVLERLKDDPRFTTELALFNLEANLPPLPMEGKFLSRMELQLNDVLHKVDDTAQDLGVRALLTGILPSLRREDLTLKNMTPKPRYRQLNEALKALGNGEFHIFIRGVDELEISPDHAMFEAANTSFQIHLQVDPDGFPDAYNLAQLITAPLLAAATNSPLFVGKRLWQETRVALFERSVDTRSPAARARGHTPRVSFGNHWLKRSVVELFQDTTGRFPIALTCDPGPPPLNLVQQGIAPKLSALMLHNGTVWRWNRACYGVADGVPHLRIENRVLPSGPTVLDEVANAALFYGLMVAMADDSPSIAERLPFKDAKGNLTKAARYGLGAEIHWLDGRRMGVDQLMLKELLPLAHQGLESLAVPADERERYLGTLEERVRRSQTGSRWMLDAYANSDPEEPWHTRMENLTGTMLKHQKSGEPVHRWPPLPTTSTSTRRETIGDIMSTELFTVRPHDVIDLAASLMEWKFFRHVPVETATGELIGLVSLRALLNLQNQTRAGLSAESPPAEPLAVESVMSRDISVVSPDMPLAEGLELLMQENRSCLLVVSDGHLVGLATERDFLKAAAAILKSAE